MIEGINPSVASAPSVLGSVAQNAGIASAPSITSVESNIRPIQPPFLSSFVALDTELNAAVLQIRDNETGDVLRTIPSDAQIQAYQRSLDTGRAVGYVPITLRDEVVQAAAQNRDTNDTAEQVQRSSQDVITQADVEQSVQQSPSVQQAQTQADISNTPNVAATSASSASSNAAVNVLV